MVGSVQRVLVQGPSKKDPRAARRAHREQSLGELRREPQSAIGQFVEVTITEALPNSLRGRLQLPAVAA